jgi:hypothetical protein
MSQHHFEGLAQKRLGVCSNADVELVESVLLLQVDNVLASRRSIVTSWNLLRLVGNLNLKLRLLPVRIERSGRTKYELMVSGSLNLEASVLVVLRLWLLTDSLWLGWYDGETSSK